MFFHVLALSMLARTSALSVAGQRQGQPTKHWEDGIDYEMDFWDKQAAKWGKWATFEEWKRRPFELQDELIARRAEAQTNFNVLDIGAGPVPALGGAITSLAGATINLTATDPLADRYKALMAKHGITSPVPVVNMMAEDVGKRFPANFFDMAYSRNALDHAKDPMIVIKDMVKLVKSGREVVIITYVNEGAGAEGVGFHQWNFANVNGKFVLWGNNAAAARDIGTELGASVSQVTCDCCSQATHTDMKFSHKDLMKCSIIKA